MIMHAATPLRPDGNLLVHDRLRHSGHARLAGGRYRARPGDCNRLSVSSTRQVLHQRCYFAFTGGCLSIIARRAHRWGTNEGCGGLDTAVKVSF